METTIIRDVEVPEVFFDFEEFANVCEKLGFNLQDQGKGVTRAFFGEEYMGAYNTNCEEGFLLEKTIAKVLGRTLH